jgi:hypothetical protein
MGENTIKIQKGDKTAVGGQYTTDAKVDQLIKRQIDSINEALIPDAMGEVIVKRPSMRDPETHQMVYVDVPHKKIDVPAHEVVYYTGGVVSDFHAQCAEGVFIKSKAHSVVFDRTYDYQGKTYYRCAWIPNKEVRAGIVFEKKINPKTKQPIAVMKKLHDDRTPRYQIVERGEGNYRDLKRIFERVFIRSGSTEDEKLDSFMHDAIGPIPEEVST